MICAKETPSMKQWVEHSKETRGMRETSASKCGCFVPKSFTFTFRYKQTLVLWVLNMSPFADYLVMYVYVICYLFYGFIKIFAAGKYFRKCFSYQDTKHGEDHDGGTRSYLCRQLPALINRAPTYLYIFNWEAFSVSWGLWGTSDEKWDKLIDPISQVIQTKFISLPLKNHPEVLLYLFIEQKMCCV